MCSMPMVQERRTIFWRLYLDSSVFLFSYGDKQDVNGAPRLDFNADVSKLDRLDRMKRDHEYAEVIRKRKFILFSDPSPDCPAQESYLPQAVFARA